MSSAKSNESLNIGSNLFNRVFIRKLGPFRQLSRHIVIFHISRPLFLILDNFILYKANIVILVVIKLLGLLVLIHLPQSIFLFLSLGILNELTNLNFTLADLIFIFTFRHLNTLLLQFNLFLSIPHIFLKLPPFFDLLILKLDHDVSSHVIGLIR